MAYRMGDRKNGYYDELYSRWVDCKLCKKRVNKYHHPVYKHNKEYDENKKMEDDSRMILKNWKYVMEEFKILYSYET